MSRQHRLAADCTALFDRLQEAAAVAQPRVLHGRLTRAVGPLLRATLPGARIGEFVTLREPEAENGVLAEVVGFSDDQVLLTPMGELRDLAAGAEVVRGLRAFDVPVGRGLLGRVLDGLGRPLDGRTLPPGPRRPVAATPPPPLARRLITAPLATGIRAIDALLTCAEGQRIGLFGEPGAGKSSLVASLVRGAACDVVVVGLIGERGREVREFLERVLRPAELARAVVVVATSDRAAVERAKAAQVATTIAEDFRDEGARVLLLMDSVTRYARALREIGLAAGEPPARRGFPPSVFAEIPRLLERAGPGERGSITAFYTVLTEGGSDGLLDPVAEEVRAVLDGHVVLSPALARAEHYPAIDILASRSRLMEAVAAPAHRAAAARLRRLLARHDEVELLLRVGEYKPGSDPLADEAIARIEPIREFLRQPMHEVTPLAATLQRLQALAA
jgi:type III secretion protein N (ATPase)